MAESSFLQSRPFYVIITLLILVLFYVAGPGTAPSVPPPQYATADARLARWLDAEVSQGAYIPQAHAYDPPVQRPLAPARAQTKINLYPLNEEPQVGKPGRREAVPVKVKAPDVVEHMVDKVGTSKNAAKVGRIARTKENIRKPTTKRLRWDAPSDDDVSSKAETVTRRAQDVVADGGLDGEFMEEELPVRRLKRRSTS